MRATTESRAFTERLRNYRDQNNYTIGDIANKLGFSKASVGQWIRGQSMPGAESLEKINAVLGENQAQAQVSPQQAESYQATSDDYVRLMFGDVAYRVSVEEFQSPTFHDEIEILRKWNARRDLGH